MATQDVYEKVTAKLIAAMEAGVIPWERPIKPAMSVHGHVYRGINALILGLSDFASPIWMTFDQARKLGGSVRKGEKGTPVMLWKASKRPAESADGEERSGFFATTFTVFNLEQTDGVKVPACFALTASTVSPSDAADAIIAGYANGPAVEHVGRQPCYIPSLDTVRIPAPGAFPSTARYYKTMFHELTHSTGHASRLGREGVTNLDKFGSHQYAKEELIAEMGAAFLCARAGIESDQLTENSAAYLKSWLGVLRGDCKLLVQAASAAQKAVDCITGAQAAQQAEAA